MNICPSNYRRWLRHCGYTLYSVLSDSLQYCYDMGVIATQYRKLEPYCKHAEVNLWGGLKSWQVHVLHYDQYNIENVYLNITITHFSILMYAKCNAYFPQACKLCSSKNLLLNIDKICKSINKLIRAHLLCARQFDDVFFYMFRFKQYLIKVL